MVEDREREPSVPAIEGRVAIRLKGEITTWSEGTYFRVQPWLYDFQGGSAEA